MHTIHLKDRALIDIAGPDAETFLQNVLTNDFAALSQGEARPSALLSPQGKILFDYLVSRTGEDGFVIETRGDVAADLVKRLMLYRLRAKAEISQRDQQAVAVSWGGDSAASSDDSSLVDRRFPAEASVVRHYGALPEETADEAAWRRLRIVHAVPESGSDYTLGDAFPHEILFDQNGGVGLKKGCFIGQEVVSRMHHRGTARRRLLIAEAQAPLPVSGTALTASGRPLGTLGTVEGNVGLAIARIDRVKEAMDAAVPVLAEEVAVALAIPAWAGFTFPAADPSSED